MTTDHPPERDDPRAVLSALIDRDTVDPDALARVLEDADARVLLVDFVRLRQAVNEDAIDEPLVATLRERHSSSEPWRPMRVLRPLAAALLVGVAGLGGMWLGERREQERPPTSTRVVSYTTGVDWHREMTERER